jgi:hypothetical protein
VNHYSRPNKGSGIKNSSTYDLSLASFSRKKLVLQETSKNQILVLMLYAFFYKQYVVPDKSIGEVEVQGKKGIFHTADL